MMRKLLCFFGSIALVSGLTFAGAVIGTLLRGDNLVDALPTAVIAAIGSATGFAIVRIFNFDDKQ